MTRKGEMRCHFGPGTLSFPLRPTSCVHERRPADLDHPTRSRLHGKADGFKGALRWWTVPRMAGLCSHHPRNLSSTLSSREGERLSERGMPG